jgi:hypothetical protein
VLGLALHRHARPHASCAEADWRPAAQRKFRTAQAVRSIQLIASLRGKRPAIMKIVLKQPSQMSPKEHIACQQDREVFNR